MEKEVKESINNVLFERVSSPLFGTIAITWIAWNWKIFYLTIFISGDKIKENKIVYIINNYSDINILIIYPLISTLILLTIIPFLSNGSYWLHMFFKQWKIKQKHIIEGKQLLTLEQSILLKRRTIEKENELDDLLNKKDTEIDLLIKQIKELEEKLNQSKPIEKFITPNTSKNTDYENLKKSKNIFNEFDTIVQSIKSIRKFPADINSFTKEYFLLNEIARETSNSDGTSNYFMTEKGNSLYKEYFNEKMHN